MQISHRVIGASTSVAPVHAAPKAAQQSSPPSVWQLRKKADQILEVKQQIETTNKYDKYRVKSLKKKLKQLERQNAFTKALSTPGSDTPTCFLSPASPATMASSTLNPTALEWKPITLPVAAPPDTNKIIPATDSYPVTTTNVAVKYDYDDYDYDDSIFFPAASSPAPSFVDSGYGSSGW